MKQYRIITEFSITYPWNNKTIYLERVKNFAATHRPNYGNIADIKDKEENKIKNDYPLGEIEFQRYHLEEKTTLLNGKTEWHRLRTLTNMYEIRE